MAVKDTLVYVVLCLQMDNIKTKILAIKVIRITFGHFQLPILQYTNSTGRFKKGKRLKKSVKDN